MPEEKFVLGLSPSGRTTKAHELRDFSTTRCGRDMRGWSRSYIPARVVRQYLGEHRCGNCKRSK